MYMLFENYAGLQPRIIHAKIFIDKPFPLNDISADQCMYLLLFQM